MLVGFLVKMGTFGFHVWLPLGARGAPHLNRRRPSHHRWLRHLHDRTIALPKHV